VKSVTFLIIVLFTALYAVAAGLREAAHTDYAFVDTSSPRRPDPRLWQTDTAGWNAGAAVASAQLFPEYDKPDPRIAEVKPEASQTTFSSGSAYLVSPGVWLTARHVVDHCKSVTVEGGDPQSGEYRLQPSHIFLSPDADAAVIRTPSTAVSVAPVALAWENRDGAEAILVGFPLGKPGAVFSRFMGHTTLRWIGTSPVQSDTIAWAETARVPDFGAEFGGLSGGLAMSPDGVAIGIVSAASPRRGRILTTQPSDLWAALRRDGQAVIQRSRSPESRITDKSFPAVARELILERRVARVECENVRAIAHH
jgi:serine protease Do